MVTGSAERRELTVRRFGGSSHVRFERKRARHDDAAVKGGDPLAGYPPRVDDPAAADSDARRGSRTRITQVQLEHAREFMLDVLDPQEAGGPPSGRNPGQQLISGKVRASRNPGPASNRSSTEEPVLTASDLATRRAVESSTGSEISTRPVRGRRPRISRPAIRAAKDACECAGSTRQLPTASRGCLPGPSWMRDVASWMRDVAVTGISFAGRLSRTWATGPGAVSARRPRLLPAVWRPDLERRARSPRRWRASRRWRTARRAPRTGRD